MSVTRANEKFCTMQL